MLVSFKRLNFYHSLWFKMSNFSFLSLISALQLSALRPKVPSPFFAEQPQVRDESRNRNRQVDGRTTAASRSTPSLGSRIIKYQKITFYLLFILRTHFQETKKWGFKICKWIVWYVLVLVLFFSPRSKRFNLMQITCLEKISRTILIIQYWFTNNTQFKPCLYYITYVNCRKL